MKSLIAQYHSAKKRRSRGKAREQDEETEETDIGGRRGNGTGDESIGAKEPRSNGSGTQVRAFCVRNRKSEQMVLVKTMTGGSAVEQESHRPCVA